MLFDPEFDLNHESLKSQWFKLNQLVMKLDHSAGESKPKAIENICAMLRNWVDS